MQDLLNASGAGPDAPIRLVVFDWASARVATALAAIFIRNQAAFRHKLVMSYPQTLKTENPNAGGNERAAFSKLQISQRLAKTSDQIRTM